MENRITISVIIPVYNAEKYLQKCLESVAAQTMTDYELILINDGSKDSSQAIIDRFTEENEKREGCKIPSIRCKIKENAGQAAARNDGLAMACGNYVAFMDSDDYLEPDYLETLYRAALENDSEAVTCGYSMVDENGRLIRKVRLSQNGIIPYGRAGMYVVWCRLYKRDFLIRENFAFQEGGKIYEDVPYSLAAKFLSRNPVVLPYEGYYYVQRPGSTMSSGAVKSSRFPYEKMTEAVDMACARTTGDAGNRLEFEVLHFFSGFFFRYCRKAEKADLDVLVSYASDMIDKKFPGYAKNPYVGVFRNKQQPLIDRMAVRIFVWAKKLGLLGCAVKLVTRI